MITNITIQINDFIGSDKFSYQTLEKIMEYADLLQRAGKAMFFASDISLKIEDRNRDIEWYWNTFFGGEKMIREYYGGIVYVKGPITITQAHPEYVVLARCFSNRLKFNLAPERNDGIDVFQKLLQEHIEGEYVNRLTCVSYDFCDARKLMNDAFTDVYMHEPNGMDDNENGLMNKAWEEAKANNFYA